MQRLSAGRGSASERGFTITELMLAVAIMGIVLAMALPNFQSTVQRRQLSACAAEIANTLQFARATAISQRATITVEAAGSWEDGWEVTNEAGDVLQTGSCNAGLALVEANGTSTFSFDRRARLSTAVLSYELCDPRQTAETGRQIDVNALGSITIDRDYVCE